MAATRSPLPPRPTSGGRSWYFFLMAFMADGNLGSAPPGSADAIDHDRARGLCDGDAGGQRDQPSGFRVRLTCRPLLIFAACAVTFHFANAAMLPLVGQKLALQDKNFGTTLMSACIVAAQIVMAPVAMLVGRKANVWGRKPLFLAGFIILPGRALHALRQPVLARRRAIARRRRSGTLRRAV